MEKGVFFPTFHGKIACNYPEFCRSTARGRSVGRGPWAVGRGPWAAKFEKFAKMNIVGNFIFI